MLIYQFVGPPDPNTGLKLNKDGAFLAKLKECGIGGVIRDSHDNWIIGFQAKTHAYNPVVMELKALENGLHLALTNHLHVTEVESNSTEVIEPLVQPSDTYHSILSSCRLLLKMLGNPVVRHNFREENRLANLLA